MQKNVCWWTNDPFQNRFKANTMQCSRRYLSAKRNHLKCKLNVRLLYACFVDFESTFDFVKRSALLFNLCSNGVQGKFLQTQKSMFQNARSRVKWGGKTAPAPGNIKINYLLLADDLVLPSGSPSGWQNLINGVEKFCSQWYMLVNLTKAKVVLFNNRFVPFHNTEAFDLNSITCQSKKRVVAFT